MFQKIQNFYIYEYLLFIICLCLHTQGGGSLKMIINRGKFDENIYTILHKHLVFTFKSKYLLPE